MTERFYFDELEGEVVDTVTTECYEVDEYRFDRGIVRKMNELDEESKQLKKEIKILNKDVEHSFSKLNKINSTLIDFSTRDLTEIERIFLKNLCRELEVSVFCCLDEERFCEGCRECIKLIEDYNSDIMSNLF